MHHNFLAKQAKLAIHHRLAILAKLAMGLH
jgi:hypothetical protein